MKKRLLAFFAFLLLGMQGAYASIIWNFSYTGPGVNGSGHFVTGDVGSPYQVTGIDGTANGLLILLLSNYAGASNLLYSPASPGYVDFGGISFSTAGGPDWNIGYLNGTWIIRSDTNPGGFFESTYPIELTVTQVPEPASLGLLALGLAGFAFVRRRKS